MTEAWTLNFKYETTHFVLYFVGKGRQVGSSSSSSSSSSSISDDEVGKYKRFGKGKSKNALSNLQQYDLVKKVVGSIKYKDIEDGNKSPRNLMGKWGS